MIQIIEFAKSLLPFSRELTAVEAIAITGCVGMALLAYVVHRVLQFLQDKGRR